MPTLVAGKNIGLQGRAALVIIVHERATCNTSAGAAIYLRVRTNLGLSESLFSAMQAS